MSSKLLASVTVILGVICGAIACGSRKPDRSDTLRKVDSVKIVASFALEDGLDKVLGEGDQKAVVEWIRKVLDHENATCACKCAPLFEIIFLVKNGGRWTVLVYEDHVICDKLCYPVSHDSVEILTKKLGLVP
jgi:hypothetical protein